MCQLFPAKVFVILGVLLLVPGPAVAHTVRPSVVTLEADAQGSVSISVRTSAEALLARIEPDVTDTNDSPNAVEYDRLRVQTPETISELFVPFADEMVTAIRLEVDGKRIPLEYVSIDTPEIGDRELTRDSMIYFRAVWPAGSESMTWHWPEAYGSNVLRVSVAGSTEPYAAWLQTGERSEPIGIGAGGTERGRLEIALDYLVIGFEHIVPKGLDHILFVVGIFLLSAKFRPLLWQVTAFTVAHTITLGLSIYGIISLSPTIVEPLIALSIAYVGIENCLYRELKPWRIGLVFMFGLLHGMGFAGVLTEIGLPRSEFLTALITFNVGVEFGQLTVIVLAFLAVGWFRNNEQYRSRVVIPLSALISVIGIYWTVERVLL
ncbi:MAG: HupE/UreJ family protein [Gammaproteobacteria bacterium]|jgi:hydrogenase/urease accessory protein HupE|nr:HupE/UreJ family protein [Gammaproteobacteria bacterium]MDP6616472.1 HupE/UreJ family protein [Gammaproteobacteria bacterium]MDP6694280.1 HupE/UreJ family protein [Gammaproteobacteria bacterium]MDP7041297.1 HupE/UreJ family protein [Gammaproteobacteria bacterium]